MIYGITNGRERNLNLTCVLQAYCFLLSELFLSQNRIIRIYLGHIGILYDRLILTKEWNTFFQHSFSRWSLKTKFKDQFHVNCHYKSHMTVLFDIYKTGYDGYKEVTFLVVKLTSNAWDFDSDRCQNMYIITKSVFLHILESTSQSFEIF